jgi:hypothetical protein
LDLEPTVSVKLRIWRMVILLTACLLAVGCIFGGWQAKTRGVEILYNLLFGVAASIIASVLMAICFIAFAAKDERISRFLEKLAAYGITDFYEQRPQISIEETLRWLKGAHPEIDILTVWRQHWAEDPEIETILLQKASIKCVVRIVLVKPESALGKLFCEKERRHKRPGGILKTGTLLETLAKHKDVFKTTGVLDMFLIRGTHNSVDGPHIVQKATKEQPTRLPILARRFSIVRC